jgi:glycerol-3-phosphate acyltransferase PlsX
MFAGLTSTNQQITLAIDAMGGDNAPDSVITGADLALEGDDNIHFKIYGDESKVLPLLKKFPRLYARSEFIHCPQVISASEKPSNAIRNFKESSMHRAIDAVKDKSADAVLSAGNTGALMAISVVTLKTLPQIHRPAIVTLMPNVKGSVVLLDLGATVESDAHNLCQFAIMGEAFAKAVLNKQKPSVGLLNIGSEEIKGKDSIKLAYAQLKESSMDFYGYVEGDDIAKGTVDVVVTDGFTGNVVLKALEGYTRVYKHLVTQAVQKSWIAKLLYLVLRPILKKMAVTIDYRKYNGAMLVGLNGIVVKSHGSTDSIGICSAIQVASSLARARINEQIAQEIVLVD